jgi:very-short-patch-repair endonuclease
MSQLSELFAFQLRAAKLEFIAEHRFHPTRRWRFDFASPARMLAIEIDGGIWTAGRHSRGAGIEGDMEKLNQAAILGWRVLRFSGGMVKSGIALLTVEQALKEIEK